MFSSAQIESLITPKTAAIIVVHYAGFPAPVEEICELAFSRNIPVIEDCAHSPYVSYKNKLLGTFGEIGCFSFFANKNITTAEGGMLINKNHENHEKCLLLRSHGMSTLSWDKHQGHSYNYDVSVPGYNYRMDDLRSSIGIAQFKKLSVINRMREQKTKLYHEILSGNPEIIIPFYNLDLPSAYYIFPVVFKTHEMREYVAHCLKEKGIQTSLHYPPIHLFSAYKSGQRALPHTEQYGQRALTLPLFPDLNDRIIEQICDIIKVGTEKR